MRVLVSKLYNVPNSRWNASPARPTFLLRNQKAAISEQQIQPLDAQRDAKGMGSSVNSLVECCDFIMYLYPSSPCHCALSTAPSLTPLNGCTCNIRVRVKHGIHTSVKHQAIVSPCFATMSEDSRDEPSRLRMYMTIVKISELGSRVVPGSSFG